MIGFQWLIQNLHSNNFQTSLKFRPIGRHHVVYHRRVQCQTNRPIRRELGALTLFLTAYFVCGSHRGWNPPHSGKSSYEGLSPIPFLHSLLYIYIRSSDPKEFFPSLKTLDLLAVQSLAANSTYALKFRKSKIYKGKSAAGFFGGPPKINRGT